MPKKYSNFFYDEMKDSSLSSAKAVVPIVMEYVNPKSVIDIGCGTGVWLKVFQDNGVSKILGLDGSWVDNDMLVIPRQFFFTQDLESPMDSSQKADLCVCLEVAEHLPDSMAKQLINKLTGIAPVVLFSAAIPFQGGSRHINEQWPKYWEKLFNENGYVAVDSLRRKIWEDKRVSFFYSQNIVFFVNKQNISNYPKLENDIRSGLNSVIPLAHPYMYTYYAERWRTIVPFLGKLPPWLLHFSKKVLNAIRKKKTSK